MEDLFFDAKHYYFDNLIHMAFLGSVCEEKDLIVHKINSKINTHFDTNSIGNNSFTELFNQDNSLNNFIKLVLQEEDVQEEYLDIFLLIMKGKGIQARDYDWKYFEINAVEQKNNQEIFAIKSIKPDGLLSNFKEFGDYTGGIYVDLYTVPQIQNEIVGFQGLITVVNERRGFYIKQKKESELNIFHAFLVDMRNRAPSLLANILEHEELSPKARKTINYSKNYIDNVINQSTKSLDLYSKYSYSDYQFKYEEISKLEDVIVKICQKEDLKKQSALSYDIDKTLFEKSSLLIPEVLDYFIHQLIKNGIKEYEQSNTPFSKREIKITLSNILVENKPRLKISVLSKNTTLTNPVVLNHAGIRPINSSSSTGLGFYFLNTLLELFKASFPLERKDRYFDILYIESTGVYINFYYSIK